MPTVALWGKYQWVSPNNVSQGSILIPWKYLSEGKRFAAQVWRMDVSKENASPGQAFNIIINFDSPSFVIGASTERQGQWQFSSTLSDNVDGPVGCFGWMPLSFEPKNGICSAFFNGSSIFWYI